MASRGKNLVILVGNLGNDPEVRYANNGNAIANISVATTEQWKDKTSGEQQEKVEWHRVVGFNRLGEIMGEYLKKGSQVYIEGKLQTRKWQDDKGADRYTTEIVANEMQMLGGRGDSTPDANPQSSAQPPMQQQAAQQQQSAPAAPKPSNDFEDDDLPF